MRENKMYEVNAVTFMADPQSAENIVSTTDWQKALRLLFNSEPQLKISVLQTLHILKVLDAALMLNVPP